MERESVNPLPDTSTVSGAIRFITLMPYLIAIGLMVVAICQVQLIVTLKQQRTAMRLEMATLQQSNALSGLHLVTLEAKDTAYGAARIIIAWDSHLHRGVISIHHLVAPPAGYDYQLWVLDPQAEAPINAGVIRMETPSRKFTVSPVSLAGPGFAVSLEPSEGQARPTGPILFAVEPEE